MSQDLKWLLVKNSNAFLVKRDGVQFSREPNNVRNLNAFKYSALANDKVVGVEVNKAGKIELAVKRIRGSAKVKPSRVFATRVLGQHMKNHTCKAAGAIRKLTQRAHYRGDLTKYAIARYHALHRALKVKGGVKPKQSKAAAAPAAAVVKA